MNTGVSKDFYLPMCHLHTFTGGIPNTATFATLDPAPHLLAQNEDGSVKIYAVMPSHFKPKIEVAACYARFKDEYLLLHRADTIRFHPSLWGVPGGKMKRGQPPSDANLREFFEETGIRLDPQKVSFFKTVYITDPDKNFTFHMFTYEFAERPPVRLKLDEHQAFIWESFEKAIQRPLIPGEVECLRFLEPESK